MSELSSIVRLNGVLPDIATIGDDTKSERAAEVKRVNMTANTSCSVFVRNNITSSNIGIFHLLVDIGDGVIRSLEKMDLSSYYNLDKMISKTSTNLPDAILLTHSHDDHIKELPLILSKYSDQQLKALKVYCTKDCYDQVISKFPRLSSKNNVNNTELFMTVKPNEAFKVGPISVVPISAYHGENSPPGGLIYILRLPDKKKIIIGWDFLSLPDIEDQNLFWNPDLTFLGAQTYNPHPETGLISVTDAFELVRRWNAKECYIVHYRGLMDFEDAKNQWFRGPTKAMGSEELQKTINENLELIGKGGKFKIIVAKEGMVWTTEESQDEWRQQSDPLSPTSNVIEIESLQDYIMVVEKDSKNDILKLVIEDRINRYDLKFIDPHIDKSNNDMLYAKGEKGMLARGPELRMEVLPSEPLREEEGSLVRINVSKGKKTVFKNDIRVNRKDTDKLRRYMKENFLPVPMTTT